MKKGFSMSQMLCSCDISDMGSVTQVLTLDCGAMRERKLSEFGTNSLNGWKAGRMVWHRNLSVDSPRCL